MRRLPLGTINPKLHLKRDLQKLTLAWVLWLVLGFMTVPAVVPLMMVWVAGYQIASEYIAYDNFGRLRARPESVRR